jgi:hypothetical protein
MQESVLENAGEIFGPNEAEETAEGRRRHNEELND